MKIKTLKDFFYAVFATDCDDIDIDEYDVVSFDIFDTLIKRNLRTPTDVFDLVERQYNLKHSHSIRNFKSNRIMAERTARKVQLQEEVTLRDIYRYLNYPCKDELMALECELEIAVSTPNYAIQRVYQACLKKHKTICVTSDMYLPMDTIRQILRKNGYKCYDKLFLSSHEKATKRTGQLFKEVIAKYRMPLQKIVHIGDSPRNDFLAAKKNGLDAILIRRDNNAARFCSSKPCSLEYNLISSFIDNTLRKHNFDLYEQYGYEVVGPILYNFTNWLHGQLDDNNLDNIFFLARDAGIIMEIFHQKFPEYTDLHYLKVSRKALIAANLNDVKTMEELLSRLQIIIKPTAKVMDLFQAINLDFNDYVEQISNQDDFSKKVIVELNKEEKAKIFNSIKPDIDLRSRVQHKYLVKYLNQENFEGKVAIVDIGWNGTIQHYLSQVCNQSVDIYGYYYGLNKNKSTYKLSSILHCAGCLFDRTSGLYYQRIIQMSIALFEIAFLSTDRSTLAYTMRADKVVPIYGEPENDVQNIKKIQKIQTGAKLFVSDAAALDCFQINCPKDFFLNYESLIRHPKLKNLKLFNDLEYLNAGKKRLFQGRSFFFYLFHPKQFYLDLENSSCKIFFLKFIFKIPLPYYNLLNTLYNFKECRGKHLKGNN